MGIEIAAGIASLVMLIVWAFIPQAAPVANVESLTTLAAEFDAANPEIVDAREWELYRIEAVMEYEDEFTALFNSYETKRAKNGRLMIRQGNSGSFKFAKTK